MSAATSRRVEDAWRSLKKYLAMVLPEYEIRLTREEGTFTRPYCKIGLAGSTGFPTAHSSATGGDVIQPFTMALYPPLGVDPDDAALAALAVEDRLYAAFLVGGGYLDVPTNCVAVAQAGASTLGAVARTYSVAAVDRERRITTLSNHAAVTPLAGQQVLVTWDGVGGAVEYAVYLGAAGAEQLLGYATDPEFVDDGAYVPAVLAPHTVNATQIAYPRRIPLWDWTGVTLDTTSGVRAQMDYMKVNDVSIGRTVDQDNDRMFSVHVDLRLQWRRSLWSTPGPLASQVTHQGTGG